MNTPAGIHMLTLDIHNPDHKLGKAAIKIFNATEYTLASPQKSKKKLNILPISIYKDY